MVPVATLAHHSRGRARLRVSSKRGDPSYFGRVRDGLGSCDGIRALKVNPFTGSVLVEHSLELADLLRLGREHELFQVEQSPETEQALASRGVQLFVQPTKSACQTFNEMVSEGRRTVAALHLTC